MFDLSTLHLHFWFCWHHFLTTTCALHRICDIFFTLHWSTDCITTTPPTNYSLFPSSNEIFYCLLHQYCGWLILPSSVGVVNCGADLWDLFWWPLLTLASWQGSSLLIFHIHTFVLHFPLHHFVYILPAYSVVIPSSSHLAHTSRWIFYICLFTHIKNLMIFPVRCTCSQCLPFTQSTLQKVIVFVYVLRPYTSFLHDMTPHHHLYSISSKIQESQFCLWWTPLSSFSSHKYICLPFITFSRVPQCVFVYVLRPYTSAIFYIQHFMNFLPRWHSTFNLFELFIPSEILSW
jgi:hypothetical protein